MSTKLFVGNLSFKTTENDLQDAFAACGTVVETNIMMDRMTGRPRGFAFDELHGKEFDGRALTVNVARPREERPPGGGGRGGDRGGDRGPRREYGGGGGRGGDRSGDRGDRGGRY